VLDIDAAKMIVDLSERLAESKASKDSSKDLKKNHKAIVELNKEQYLILTFKNARQQVGVCIPNDFTQVNKTELYAKYQVGSEVTVRFISSNKDGFILTLPAEE
jgi:predicted RNA-binding protein (virulence factor B family)